MTRRKQKKSEKRKPIIFRELRIQKLLALGWIENAWEIPATAIPVDPDMARFGSSPSSHYYQDQSFICTNCGERCVWRAEDQLWYYEVAHGSFVQTAVRCLSCRRGRQKLRNRNS